ncbi:recombination mediator RecR [Candidatus Bodocaedibacter vickermanii]|uniref:Recombination protein RecR n=1 Tax=Candidatus Bodocaedibacter vickermanii TaxID=2741701 RepID=A0A7L9RS70_9PROT|nr:Recombination protein RecR [Candidatus Paracaedibacteraceae bacterium 'Lake Konstanz']
MVGADIEGLIKFFSKMPGLGPRSARRFVLYLLKHKQQKLLPLIDLLAHTAEHVSECTECGNLDTENPCTICSNQRRNKAHLCVVEHVADLWALERSGAFQGIYHVLGGTLSALDGIGPDELRIPYLKQRIQSNQTTELTLALNVTLEGQTTNHYLAAELASPGLKITSIAHGVPLGGELDYLDSGTLITALAARRTLETEES